MKSLKSEFLDSDVIPISAKKFNLQKVLETSLSLIYMNLHLFMIN